MTSITDHFNRPWWLVLLVIILPALWIFSYKTLSGLGPIRKWFALLFRSIVITAIVLALAEMQFFRKHDRVTVIYLLDQSESIPKQQREAMVDYVKEQVMEYRDASRGDRAALIVFGREANIEIPPIEADLPIMRNLETVFDLRTDATNLAGALKLAQATFPEDSARRVVVVTDGNENRGDAHAMAQRLAQDGVGIDIKPILLGDHQEIAVERLTLPGDIRKGQPFTAKVVVNNITVPGTAGDGIVQGKLKLSRRVGQQVETLDEQEVELKPGKNVFSFDNEINISDFYQYQADISVENTTHDVLQQNNRATAFTHVLGQGHVLIIENWDTRGEFDFLAERLQRENLQVTIQPSNQLFSSMSDLQRYDTVVLANVPRSSVAAGPEVDDMGVTNFSDEQISTLVQNTHEMGCGLVMIGGPNSFGAGGWQNSDLEKALPVDFQIHNAKVAPIGALCMVMHAGEMAAGNHWQKVVAEEALKSLGPQDYCGIVHWQGKEEWLWSNPVGMIRVGPNKNQMRAKLSRMTPGDMPDFDPSMKMAAAAFSNLKGKASLMHMIIISDGDPSPASMKVLQDLKKLKAKVSTVAVGSHGFVGHQELKRIANFTGGKYYVVRNPKTLPKIYQTEARRVARPLVKEKVVTPIITSRHEILQGIDALPPISGFVLTSVKENPLVDVSLISPDPVDTKNATLLATWNYGLGKAAVLTTDAGTRWANQWTSWQNYDKFFSQLVRWTMRPTGDLGNYSVATNYKDGRVRVVVTAIDEEDKLLSFLNVSASAVGPTMTSNSFEIRQTAPGRYVGEFEAEDPGSYFLAITPGSGKAPLRTGVNVPYSAEYRDRETNDLLIENLAALIPVGGKKGQIDSENPFRRDLPKAYSSRDIWPLLVLFSCCVFFADVFIRRVSVNFDWVPVVFRKATDFVLRREPEPVVDERMERLRSRKQEVEGQIDERRSAARFEPEPDADVSLDSLDSEAAASNVKPSKPRDKSRTEMTPAEADDDTYTSRLLKAKKKVWKDD